MQAFKGYLLKTSLVKEDLLPIRRANETKAPVPNDTFDSSLHRHLDYVRELPDSTSTQVLWAKKKKRLCRRIFIREEDLVVWSKMLSMLQAVTHYLVSAIGQVDLTVKDILT
jgi:hypothetical protein